jgi:hypothetical protein
MDLHHRARLRAPRVLWLLPWALLLVASTSLAYAMNVAMENSPSARPPQVDVSLTPADLRTAGAFFYDEEVDGACNGAPCRRVRRWLPAAIGSCGTTDDRQRYVGLNTWIPAGPNVDLCRDDGS